MGFSYITHKNKQILFIDYKPCKGAPDMIKLINEVAVEYQSKPGPFLVLNDFTGNIGTKEFMQHANTLAKIFNPKTKKSAMLGINSGIRQLLVQAYMRLAGRKILLCSSKEEALDYLVSL
ncbi:MAG TPA: hypothetical protein DCQ31_18920 [Bacteroidales bacterium]|nr:hypothetical protein [Bacteroidales bacterium]